PGRRSRQRGSAGTHNQRLWLWVPAFAGTTRVGATMPTAFVALFTFQTAHLVPAAHFLHPGFAPLLRSPESRGGRSAERRSGACEAPVGRAILRQRRANALMTRHTRRLRGALRPMTRRTAGGNNVIISRLIAASVPIVSQTGD